MKKKFLIVVVLAVLAAAFSTPAVIYAEPDAIIRSLEQEAAESALAENEKPVFSPPLDGIITSRFGYRKSGFHHGLDIANDWGTNVGAIADGTVIEAGWKSSVYGYAVVIDHGSGWQSLYGHCGMLTVKVGQQVQTGDVIAIEGSTGRSTGPHVHLEIIKDGVYLDPEDFVSVRE